MVVAGRYIVGREEKTAEKNGKCLESAENGACRKRRFWTEKEIAYLKSGVGILTPEQMAEHLDRSVYSVKSFCCKKGIKHGKRVYADGVVRVYWTQAEITALMGYAETLTIEHAAARLGRSYASVQNKADELKISFKHQRLRLQDVADILRVSITVVKRRRKKLGLNFRHIKGNSRKRSDTRGATGKDIVAIAKDLLENPSFRGLDRTSAKHLRQVIEEYEGWE